MLLHLIENYTADSSRFGDALASKTFGAYATQTQAKSDNHPTKNYNCHHIMLVASKLKKFDFDDLLMDLPLGKKLKRGPKRCHIA